MISLWLVAFSVACTALVILVNHLFSYWKRKGIPSVRANPPFGCLGPVIRQKQSVGDLIRDIYFNSHEPIVGLYCLYQPVLLIRDPDLVKRILVTDFEHFVERGFPYDEINDPVGTNLFAMPGKRWRWLRPKLSPTFTSAKLKAMHPCIVEKILVLKDHLDGLIETKNDVVSMKDLLGFTNMSFLATTFFGFEFNALADQNHEFVLMGRSFFESKTIRSRFVNAAMFSFPAAFKLLKFTFLPRDSTRYALKLVKSVMNLRQSDESLRRNDFIQTLLELMEDSENNNDAKSEKSDEKLSLEMGAAQAFIFYAGGYETSANVGAFCLWELARSPEWLSKVQQEVDVLMERRNGKILYDDRGDLKIVDMCVKETLRKYAVAPMLIRVCTKDYKVPGMDFVIEKGTPLFISTLGMHMDERFFPNPEVFDPDRFNVDNSIESLPYYPVGAGPRFCIGARLAMNILVVQLCYMIYNYNFTAIDDKMRFIPHGITLQDENGVRLRIEKRIHDQRG